MVLLRFVYTSTVLTVASYYLYLRVNNIWLQIKPDEAYPYIHIYKWRLQQEHNMKAKNGGRGMTDEQVEA